MYLMLNDTAVMRFDFEKNIYEVLNAQLLPFRLREAVCTMPERTFASLDSYLKASEKNREILRYFFAHRVLTLSRRNAKKIYDALREEQDQTDINRSNIALKYHAASILDNYWTKEEAETVQFQDISIRENPLNEVLTIAALQGASVSLEGSVCSPEIATDGTAAKGWKRENDRLWLYKKGGRQKMEVIVSNLLDNMNIRHVPYEDASDAGSYCAKCPCMSDAGQNVVPAVDVLAYCARTRRKLPDDEGYYKMWIADYLISNSDRHGRNWGYYFDAVTGRLLGTHPLFDHDHAFDESVMENPNIPYRAAYQYTMKQAAHIARKKVDIYYKRDFEREDFQTDRQYDSFMERVRELDIRKRG